jgi:autotransporter-associated beta strand protein
MINVNPDPAKPHSEATALNGNDAANQTSITFTVSGLLWNPGTTLTLKWADINDAGNDNGLAVDNLTFAAISTTVNTVVWNTTDGTWDTTTPNWSGAATTFTNGDIAQFTDAHVGVVNIDTGGVTPALVEVKNTVGTYTFQGGALTGNGSFVKTGAGTVILNAANNLIGGVDVQAGTFKTGNSDLLSDTAPVTVGAGATLDLQDNVDTIGALTLRGGTVASGESGLLTLGGNVAVEQNAQTAYITGVLNTGSPAHTVTVADGASAIDLQIDAALAGGARLTFAGAGTTALNGDNSGFAGGISLSLDSKLLLGNANALGTGSFFFNGGTVVATTNLTGANAITNPVSVGGNVVIDGTNPIEFTKLTNNFGSATKTTTIIGSVTFSGILANSTATPPVLGVLNKLGTGTLTLTAVNTYTGATTVQAGSLVISETGAIAGSPTLTLSSGATLQLQNAISLYNGIRLNLVTGSIVDLDFAGVETIGFLAINGTLLGTDNYTLAELQALSGGVTFLGNSDASFEVTNVVPEPGTVGLLLLGLGAVVFAVRRRPVQA